MNGNNWGGARKGAGRKPTGKKAVNITLTLTTPEANELRARAKYEGISVSRFVSRYLHLDFISNDLGGI